MLIVWGSFKEHFRKAPEATCTYISVMAQPFKIQSKAYSAPT